MASFATGKQVFDQGGEDNAEDEQGRNDEQENEDGDHWYILGA